MSVLTDTQARFQAYVLAADGGIVTEIAGANDAFRRTRLDIYYNAYRLRLAEALGTDYAMLKAYIGDEIFDAIVRDYIDARPSVFRNVRWFGGDLADYLREEPRYAGQPILADLARFEWALGLAFDAADMTALRFEDVAAVPPEAWDGLRLMPHPALHVVELRTNAVTVWNQLKNAEQGIAPESLPAPLRWAIWRKQFSPYFRSLEDDEAWALGAVWNHLNFGEICTGLCQWLPEEQAASRAAILLRGWVDEGWIASLETA
ncbi:MAG TPA: DNA-binding domain-containing protein [Burkholderiales bacterium]|nr:DNA-binding domain-containing protein [Burkholderiales bacterium]